MKKLIVILGVIGLIVIVGLYAKQKYYDPKHRIDNARNEMK